MDVVILLLTVGALFVGSFVAADAMSTRVGRAGIWYPLFVLPTLFACGRIVLWFEEYTQLHHPD